MLERLVLTFGYAAAVCVGLVFLIAGIDKLRHRRLLPGVIANYRLLPEGLVSPAANALPLVELALGLALIAGETLFSPLLGVALLLAFAGAMAVNLKRGRAEIDCGCGQSHLRQRLSWALVGRNVVLAALLLPRIGAQALPPMPDGAIALAGGVAIFLIYLLFNALLSLSAFGSHQGHTHAHTHQAHR